MVIIIVYDLKPERLGISRTFILPYQIFFFREYVRVAVIYDRGNAMLEHGLDDCAGTRGAACVEKDSRLPHRSL